MLELYHPMFTDAVLELGPGSVFQSSLLGWMLRIIIKKRWGVIALKVCCFKQSLDGFEMTSLGAKHDLALLPGLQEWRNGDDYPPIKLPLL